MQDLSRTLRSAFTRALNRRSRLRNGRIEVIDDFPSAILGNQRKLSVYLPPGYDERREHRYPVLYMQDGQNLFDPSRAFAGQPWRLQNAADEAIGARTAEPMIIVGVDHAGPGRMTEYTPMPDAVKGGGRADDYGRMLLEEVKPLVDERFRTVPQLTAIGGSSLGGLVSLHLALTRADAFRSAAVMSPSVWWSGRAILGEVEAAATAPRARIWLDIGGREGRDALNDARTLRDRLLAKGWNESDFRFFEDRRADHSERAWASRARRVLEFLFPPDSLFAGG